MRGRRRKGRGGGGRRRGRVRLSMLARTISYTILHGGTQVSQCREQLTFHLSLAKAGRKEKTIHRVILHDSHMTVM